MKLGQRSYSIIIENDLIQSLDSLGFEWIRLHYAHPAHLSKKIINALAESKNFCNYLDFSINDLLP